jgi:hypothetical protein
VKKENSTRALVKKYLIEKMGYWNFIKETEGKYTIHRDGWVEYYAYGEDRTVHVDEIQEQMQGGGQMTKQCDKQHYLKMFRKNSNTTVGFTLAAQAIYAARYGVFDSNYNHNAYMEIAKEIEQKYGEYLTSEQVLAEMETEKAAATTIIVRKVPEQLRREFKARCAQDGISQQDKIIELMSNYATK